MIPPQMSWEILIAVTKTFQVILTHKFPTSSFELIHPWTTRRKTFCRGLFIYICMSLVSRSRALGRILKRYILNLWRSRALGRILNRSILQEESGSHEDFKGWQPLTLYRSHDRCRTRLAIWCIVKLNWKRARGRIAP
jgi:hypothetical protein